MPRTIEVELTGGLVDAAAAGDAVTVLGWVKVIATDPVAAGWRAKWSATPRRPTVARDILTSQILELLPKLNLRPRLSGAEPHSHRAAACL